MSALSDLKNALFVPVSDDDDDGDEQLVIAAVDDDDWDEKKHPRDKKGKFTDKGLGALTSPATALTSIANAPKKTAKKTAYGQVAGKKIAKKTAAQVQVGIDYAQTHAQQPDQKPLSINTNVIYKQKYANGDVVAEKFLTTSKFRLTWDAKKKKFIHQGIGSGLDEWQDIGEFGKGETYKIFSKQTGWLTPSKSTASTPKLATSKLAPNGILNFGKMSSAQVNDWFAKLTPELLNSLSDADRKAVELAAFDENQKGNSVPFDKLAKLTSTLTPTPTLKLDPSESLVDFLEDAPQSTVIAWFDNITQSDYDALPIDDQEALDMYLGGNYDLPSSINVDTKLAQLRAGTFGGKSVSELSAVDSTPKVTAAPPVIPANAPHGYKHHVDATTSVGFVGDIGQPKLGVTKFNSVSAAKMKMIQEKSKSSWTPEQVNAVQLYTTSPGYQAMNAVLRADQKMLDKFDNYTLAQAVQSAQHVQAAMAPLVESIELHRGTGAQQFGFPDKHVSTADLKKLQGQVIQDRGFVSTSVIMPKNISYDYAKKPIKVIIKAPEGTPAVYVTSVTPSWSKENEVVLAAGTSFHVSEVRGATDADKLKYGGHTEQVVVLEVVPATSKAEPKLLPGVTPTPTLTVSPSNVDTSAIGTNIKDAIAKFSYYTTSQSEIDNLFATLTQSDYDTLTTSEKLTLSQIALDQDNHGNSLPFTKLETLKVKAAALGTVSTPAATPSVISTPLKSAGPSAGTPLKINTKVIHSTKYAHAAVVAVKPLPPGGNFSAQRLVWSEDSKKFTLQNLNANGTWVNAGFSYTKKDAYNTFSKESGWQAPTLGENALGTGTFGSGPMPKVSATDGVATPAPAPVKTTSTSDAKVSKFDAAELKKLHGGVPANWLKYGDAAVQQLKKNFAQNVKHKGVQYSSPPEQIFAAIKTTIDTEYVSDKINLLQALQLLDEGSTSPGTANKNLFEKKIVDWLLTATGKTTAYKIINNVHTPQVEAKLAELVEPTDISKPKTNATHFKTIDHTTASVLQNHALAGNPWTPEQKQSLQTYTGGSFEVINGILRQIPESKSWTESTKIVNAEHAVNAQAGMRPWPESVVVFRGTDIEQFGLSYGSKAADVKQFEGKVITDKGFMSTSVSNFGAFSGKVQLTIEVPAGTPAAYLDDISWHEGERELLLAAGLRYKVLKVDVTSWGTANVTMRVVP